MERDIVTSSYSVAVTAFLDTYLDDYWRGYKPSWAYNNKKKDNGNKKKGKHNDQNLSHAELLPKDHFRSLFHEVDASGLHPQHNHRQSSLGSSIDESIFYRCISEDDDSNSGYDVLIDDNDEKDFNNDFEMATTMATSVSNDCSSFETSQSFENGASGPIDLSCHFLSSDDPIDRHCKHAAEPERVHSADRNAGCNQSLVPGHLVTVPQDWMLTQTSSCGNRQSYTSNHNNNSSNYQQGNLSCPNCATVCGYWQKEALSLLGDFNLCDLFALQESSVRTKRRIRVKMN